MQSAEGRFVKLTQARASIDLRGGAGSNESPMEARIKQDFNSILIKFAESFVSNDVLRKRVLVEELDKFRDTNKLELTNIYLKEEVKRKTEEIVMLNQNTKEQEVQYENALVELRRELDNQRKDKMIVMNQMIKSMETEKNTRVKAYSFLTKKIETVEQENEIHFDVKKRDRLAQNSDDVDFYKARLLDKVNQQETEANIRINMRNFTKRITSTEEGLKLYGHPKSLDHIYGIW